MKIFNRELIKLFPRESTLFTKEYFKDKEITAIEIGTLKGENAKSIFKELNIKNITLIDPYEFYEEGVYNLQEMKKKAIKRLERYAYKIKWIYKYSSDAANEIKEKVDFIYIDGNHEYEFVIKDLELYFGLVKDEGIIAGHDIQYPGVSDAVIEFCKVNKLRLHIGERRDWWVVK